MRTAIISDIHGNLPALKAVLEDINKRKIDKTICIGDIIGKGPSSKETIDICRKSCDFIVCGNWEVELYEAYCKLRKGRRKELSERALWYK